MAWSSAPEGFAEQISPGGLGRKGVCREGGGWKERTGNGDIGHPVCTAREE